MDDKPTPTPTPTERTETRTVPANREARRRLERAAGGEPFSRGMGERIPSRDR